MNTSGFVNNNSSRSFMTRLTVDKSKGIAILSKYENDPAKLVNILSILIKCAYAIHIKNKPDQNTLEAELKDLIGNTEHTDALLDLTSSRLGFTGKSISSDFERYLSDLHSKAAIHLSNVKKSFLSDRQLLNFLYESKILTKDYVDNFATIKIENRELKSNLSGLNFTRSELTNVILSESILTGAILHYSTFRKVTLEKTVLAKEKDTIEIFKVINSKFGGAIINHIKLIRSIWRGVNLDKAKMIGTNLSSANITDCTFYNADLTEAIFEGATLCKTDGPDIIPDKSEHTTDVNFTDAKLIDTKFIKVNATKVIFIDANLSGADLNGTNFFGANFSGAVMNNVYIKGAKFNLAIFRDTEITLKFRTSNHIADDLDIDFNHINNHNSGSILTAIDSIYDEYKNIDSASISNERKELLKSKHGEYKTLKINLMKQVIEHLKDKDITSIVLPLKDILLKNKIYMEDKEIGEFIVEKLLGSTKSHDWKAISNPEILTMLNLTNTQNEDFFINHNNFFIMLTYHGLTREDNKTQELATELYNKYLNIKPIDNIKASLDHSCEWENDYTDNDYKFIFYSNKNNKSQALVVSHDYLDKFYGRTLIEWGGFFHYEYSDAKIKPHAEQSLDETFKVFTVFEADYQFAKNKITFIKLIDILPLDDEYNTLFKKALEGKSFTKKLVDPDSEKKLSTLLNPVFINPLSKLEDLSLKDTICESILNNFKIKDSSSQIKAQTLLALAGTFTYYSSSNIFGGEAASPDKIRFFAYALMKQAYTLDKTVFPNSDTGATLYIDWKNRLLGFEDAFTCTAVLSSAILKHCKSNFKGIANAIIPPAWH